MGLDRRFALACLLAAAAWGRAEEPLSCPPPRPQDGPFQLSESLFNQENAPLGWFGSVETQILKPYLKTTLTTPQNLGPGLPVLPVLRNGTLDWTAAPKLTAGYRTEWGGEFEQMKEAETRLMIIIPISLVLIFLLLYVAFRSLLDSVVVLSNVVDLSIGGIWALILTGTNFSVAAAVGFVSLFGVAIMDGLLMISSFNALRAKGVPLEEAIMLGAEKRVRPVVMTALTAILDLLPAALALRPAWDPTGHFRLIEPLGVQTQRPLAVVVVGGMITTLLLTRYMMPVLYSFYGDREPPEGAGDMAH